MNRGWILGVRREYIEASFGEMHDTFGSIENYFAAGLGLAAAIQERLCTQLMEP